MTGLKGFPSQDWVGTQTHSFWTAWSDFNQTDLVNAFRCIALHCIKEGLVNDAGNIKDKHKEVVYDTVAISLNIKRSVVRQDAERVDRIMAFALVDAAGANVIPLDAPQTLQARKDHQELHRSQLQAIQANAQSESRIDLDISDDDDEAEAGEAPAGGMSDGDVSYQSTDDEHLPPKKKRKRGPKLQSASTGLSKQVKRGAIGDLDIDLFQAEAPVLRGRRTDHLPPMSAKEVEMKSREAYVNYRKEEAHLRTLRLDKAPAAQALQAADKSFMESDPECWKWFHNEYLKGASRKTALRGKLDESITDFRRMGRRQADKRLKKKMQSLGAQQAKPGKKVYSRTELIVGKFAVAPPETLNGGYGEPVLDAGDAAEQGEEEGDMDDSDCDVPDESDDEIMRAAVRGA